MGRHKSSAKREIHSNTGLLQKEERSQIDNLTQYLNKLEKEDYITITHLENKRIIKIKITNFFDDL